jgi:hypothetical protein
MFKKIEIINKMKFTQETYLKKVKEVHGNTYDYSETIFTKSSKKIKIICKIHGVFEQNAYKHLLGRGCQTCGIENQTKPQIVSFDEFKQRAVKKHGTKFEYFEDSFISLKNKLKIQCPLHGIFEMTGDSHLVSKHGCKRCGFIGITKNKTRSHDDFISVANEIHKNKYDYSLVNKEKPFEKVIIICKTHGEFQQFRNCHLLGRGCKKCANDLNGNKYRTPLVEYIQKANKVHNNIYDYSLVKYKNKQTKIKIKCSIHGIFEKIAGEHLNGQGCQKCKPKKYSKVCIEWLNYMKVRDKANIQHCENEANNGEHRVNNSLFFADGFCKETNTIYEFHGSYWHGDPTLYKLTDIQKHTGKSFGELYEKTLKKIDFCKSQGYNVIECWESKWIKGIKAVKLLQKKFKNRDFRLEHDLNHGC